MSIGTGGTGQQLRAAMALRTSGLRPSWKGCAPPSIVAFARVCNLHCHVWIGICCRYHCFDTVLGPSLAASYTLLKILDTAVCPSSLCKLLVACYWSPTFSTALPHAHARRHVYMCLPLRRGEHSRYGVSTHV